MRFSGRHKRVLYLIAGLLLLAGRFCFSTPWTDAPSPFTAPPLEGVSARTEQSRYSSAVREIPVTLYSCTAEFHTGCHAVLERQRGGVWYTLRRNPFCRIVPPAMEAAVVPGETWDYFVFSREYGFRLRPGHYRAVFPGLSGQEYVCAEFEIG